MRKNARERFFSVVTTSWLLLLHNVAFAGGPTTPTELRIAAYSKSTVEIFWSRAYDDQGVIGYELIRNGQTHWLGDVTSYLDSSVHQHLTVNYNIVAVDTDHNRSSMSATLTFSNSNGNSSSCSGTTSCSSSSVSISSPDSSVDHTLPVPASIRGDVYSNSALELFWDAVEVPQGIKGYDVYRNGDLLTQTSGTSHFDSNLSAGTQYRYTVYTIGQDNQRSENFAAIDMRTTGQGGEVGGSTASSSVSHADSSGSNLTGSVWGDTYSSSAAEIFWDYTGSDVISLFEVVRNGAIVQQTSGRSYYDESLGADTVYRFEVRAISGANSRTLGSVDLKTPSQW